jgi:hypothetical protein
MTKVTKECPNVLKQKLISLEMITDKKLIEPLDYYSQTTAEPAKLLYRLTNSWLLSDPSRTLLTLLTSGYDTLFGDCLNKLRLVLDLLAIGYKTSFVFVSDGALEDRLKKEVVEKAGEKMT